MRFLRDHTGLHKVVPWIKERPMHLVGCGVLVALGCWYLSPWAGSAPRRTRYGPVAAPALVTPLPLHRDQEANASLQDQKALHDLQAHVKQSETTTRDLRHALATKEQEHKQALTGLAQRLEGVEKRLTESPAQKAVTVKAPVVRTGPSDREKQLQAQLDRLTQAQKTSSPPPRGERYGTMQVYTAKHLDLPTPAAANRADIPYLGLGCVGPFTLATGGDTTINTDRSRPVLLSMTEPFRCASQLQGPDQMPLTTTIPVRGCVALAAVKADMSAGRAMGETTHLGCVMPDRSYFERPFKAYLVDAEGNLGLVGEVVRHESAKIFAAALSSIMQEASALLAAARSNIVVSGTPSSGQQYFSGIQSGFNQMTTYFLEQARNLTPTVFVHRGQQGYVVVLEGLPMDGMPMVNTVSTGKGW